MPSPVVLTTTSASPQNWMPPADCPAGTVVRIEAWGAGSGGSGSSTSFRSGGAGGAWSSTYYTITASDVTNGIAYTIQNGSAGTAAANPLAGPDGVIGVKPKNLIPNSTNYGAVVGGALPLGWTTIPAGLTISVAGTGVDVGTGLNYVDLTFSGTTSGTAFGVIMGNTNSVNSVPISPSIPYIASGYCWVTVGTMANTTAVNFQQNWYTSAAVYVATGNSYGQNATPPTFPTALTRYSGSTVTPGATAAMISPIYVVWTCASGVAISFTIRLAGFQLEQASSVSAYQATPTSYVLADGGGAASGTAGGTGTHAGNCFGIQMFKGGNGAGRSAGGGGGGGAGKDGVGTAATTATGGTGDAGSGGAANTANVEGGGGGTAGNPGNVGGAPAGAGGANTSTGTGYAGGRGQIRITYTPQVLASATIDFNDLFGSGTADAVVASDNASVLQSIDLAAAGAASNPNPVSATNSLTLAAVSLFQNRTPAAATDSFFSLISIVSAGQADRVSASNSLAVLSAAGTGYDWFFSERANVDFTSTASLGQSDAATATASIAFSASANGTNQLPVYKRSAIVASFWPTYFIETGPRTAAVGPDFVIETVATAPAPSAITATAVAAISFSSAITAGQLNSASATDTVATITAAVAASNPNPGSATNAFATLTAVVSVLNRTPASAVNNIDDLAVVSTILNRTPASAVNGFATITAVSAVMNPTPCQATASGLSLSSIVSLGQADQVASTSTFASISSAATAYDWFFSGASALLSLTATGAAAEYDQASATNNQNLTAAASVGQSDQASASNTFPFSATASLLLSNGASATGSSFSGLQTIAAVQQYDQASATQSVGTFTASAAVMNPVPAAGLGLLTLAAVGATAQYDQASAALSLLFTAAGAAGQQDLAQAADNFLGLSAVIQVQNPLAASATASLDILAAGALGQSDPVSATATVRLSTVSQLVLGNGVRAINNFTALVGASSVLNRTPASAGNSLEVLTAQVSVSNPTPVNGTNSINLAAAIAAQQYDQAHATAVFGNLSASAAVAEYDLASATQSLEILTAVVQLGQSNAVQATNDLDLSVVATVQTKVSASATNTVLFNGSGAAYQFDLASATAAISLTAVADAGFTNPIAGLQAIDIDAHGIVGQVNSASAADSIDFSFIGRARQELAVEAFGQAAFMGLQATGAVKKFALGLHRQIWFDKDDRYVYWPTTQTSRSPRPPDPTLMPEGRRVYWPPSASARR